MKRPARPRIRDGETEEDFAARLQQWREIDRAYMRAYSAAQRTIEFPEQREKRLSEARARKARLGKEHLAATRAAHFRANREQERANQLRFYEANPDAKKIHDARYRDANRDKVNAYFVTPEYRERRNAREKARYQSDEAYRIEKCLRATLNQALRLQGAEKKARTMPLIGCSIDKLMMHLAEQFTDGMSWSNYGEWEIDHRKPCASFDLSDPVQQEACFRYSNLQPLWREANRRKGAKITE